MKNLEVLEGLKKESLIANSEKIAVENYPYGFKLRTTLFDTIEYKKNQGYRHVTQTINPKNNALNKPKASTYTFFMIRYYDENQHIKCLHFDLFISIEKFNDLVKEFSLIWDVLSDFEKEYILVNLKQFLTMSIRSAVGFKKITVESGKTEHKKFFDYINSFTNFEERLIKKELKDVIISYNIDSNILLDAPLLTFKAYEAETV